jgi:pimeloyl-ACP methyl ester carboxylesterase
MATTGVTVHQRKSPLWRIGAGLAVSLLLIYVGLCTLFYFAQGLMTFPAPKRYPRVTPLDAGIPFEDLHIPVDGSEQIHAWWIPASSPSNQVLLVFHGNGYVMEQGFAGELQPWGEFIPLHRVGPNLLLVDYRGYGSSSPTATNEKSVYEDARAAFNYLSVQRAVPNRNIILVGRSIGTGVATEMAEEHPDAGGLILISPFTSVGDIAKNIWYLRPIPLSILLRDKLENLSKIASVHIPVFFIAGAKDDLTPPVMAQTLFQRANQPKQLYLVSGANHNDITAIGGPVLEDRISAFLQTIQ